MNTIDDFDDDQHLVVSGNGLCVYPKGKIPASRDVPEGGFVTSVGNWKLKERLHKKRVNEKVGNAAGQGVPGRRVSDAYVYLKDSVPGHVMIGVTGGDGPYGEQPAEGKDEGWLKFFGGKAKFQSENPSKVTDTLKISTTPEHDKEVMELIKQRMQNPGQYSAIGDSCVNAVDDILKESGVKTPDEPSIWPKKFFEQIKEMNNGKANAYQGYVPPK